MSSQEDLTRTRAAPSGANYPAVQTPALAPGERVGPFVVEGVLGRGGQATVYRAVHLALGIPAALKLLHVVDRSQVKRFLQDWLDHLPPGARTPARTRAELAVRQIRDDAPSAPSTPAAPAAATGGAR